MSSNDLPAGDFGVWLAEMRAALDGAESDVACGDCSACCTSAQFIHIGPDEVETIEHIPSELLVAAPGLNDGTVVLGYNNRGHCPMLSGGRCSIYEYRPNACRVYDCRVFAATAIVPDRPAIAEQTGRWVFSGGGEVRSAIVAAARYLSEHGNDLPPELVPSHPTRIAVAAIRIHREFTDGSPNLSAVEAALRATG